MTCRGILDERSLVDATAAVAHCDLPGTPAAAPLARRFVRTFLAGVPRDVLHDVLLLTSELVTNVVIHARTDVRIGVSFDENTVLVAVEDSSSQPPGQCSEVRPEMLDAVGRGMAIIAALAGDFGWNRSPGRPGKTMWFTVPIRVPPVAAVTIVEQVPADRDRLMR